MDAAAHVLVVDDDQEIRRLLDRYLPAQGFRVSTAAGGKSTASKNHTFRFANFTVERSARRVLTEGREVQFTPVEFDFLIAFLDWPRRVLSREQLLDITQGRDAKTFDRSIDALISRLCRKLSDSEDPQIIKTLRNVGYQLSARVDAEESNA